MKGQERAGALVGFMSQGTCGCYSLAVVPGGSKGEVRGALAN